MADTGQHKITLLSPEQEDEQRKKVGGFNKAPPNKQTGSDPVFQNGSSRETYWPYKLHIIEIIIWLILILEIVWPALFLLASLDLGHAGPLNLLITQIQPAMITTIQSKMAKLTQDQNPLREEDLLANQNQDHPPALPYPLQSSKLRVKAMQEALQWFEVEALNGTKLLMGKNRASSMTMNDLSKLLKAPSQTIPVSLSQVCFSLGLGFVH